MMSLIDFRAFILLLLLIDLSDQVVVDGNKRKDLSAIRKQRSDEKQSIDSYNTKTCGISNPNSEDHEFINMAREGQFPWIVSLQIKVLQDGNMKEQKKESLKTINSASSLAKRQHRKLEDLHFCSGSFISDKWILSAAHCFVGDTIKHYYQNDKLKVVAGSHKVSSRYRLNRNLTIERIYYHAKFSKSMPIGYDIALVELTEPVNFATKRHVDEFGEQNAPYMNTVCLPLDRKRYSFNETARIAGWGLSSAKDISSMPSKLLTTDILLTDQEKCIEHYEKALNSSEPRRQAEQEDDFLCANYKNTRDACQSDSGGPLMQYVNKKVVVIGIVSYGIGCATKGVPGLYTRTSAYIDWIKAITREGTKAKVNFKVFEKQHASGTVDRETHRVFETTTTKKPPPTGSKDDFTTVYPASDGSTDASGS